MIDGLRSLGGIRGDLSPSCPRCTSHFLFWSFYDPYSSQRIFRSGESFCHLATVNRGNDQWWIILIKIHKNIIQIPIYSTENNKTKKSITSYLQQPKVKESCRRFSFETRQRFLGPFLHREQHPCVSFKALPQFALPHSMVTLIIANSNEI